MVHEITYRSVILGKKATLHNCGSLNNVGG